jgi:hypothetical protein
MNSTLGLSSALACALLAGCAATCPPTVAPEVVTKTRIVDTGCDWVKPIYLDKSDVLSDATAKAILAHDQAGAKICNWKPLK